MEEKNNQNIEEATEYKVSAELEAPVESEMPSESHTSGRNPKNKASKKLIFIVSGALTVVAIALFLILVVFRHEHQWEDAAVIESSTCTKNGLKEIVCSECGKKKEQQLELAEHTWGTWETVVESTCSEEGEKKHICNACGFIETQTVPISVEHTDLVTKISSAIKDTPYSELYELYTSALNHKNSCNCDLSMSNLFSCMLYGKWSDANDNYISLQYTYKNYDNTRGSSTLSTNLKTSKDSGASSYYYYYYFADPTENGISVGYYPQHTADNPEKTINFDIEFFENHIKLQSKIDGKEYILNNVTSFKKVVKDNAKTAYNYIIYNINSFKNPYSVEILDCYVDGSLVYAKVRATNSWGGYGVDWYIFTVAYVMEKTPTSPITNVDVDELNRMIQNYLNR